MPVIYDAWVYLARARCHWCSSVSRVCNFAVWPIQAGYFSLSCFDLADSVWDILVWLFQCGNISVTTLLYITT